VLETDRWIAVGHRLRRLEVLRTSAESEVLRHLGPDVLGPDWDAAEATRRLIASPERESGEALIDQSVMAGPGTSTGRRCASSPGSTLEHPSGRFRTPGSSST
jgi:endonuclease-8